MAEKNIEKIVQLGEKGKVKKLLPYATSKDADERAAAATALGKSNEDDAFNALVTLLRDNDPSVQLAAVHAVGELGRPMGKEYIRYIMSNTENAQLKEAGAQALAKLTEQHRS